MYYCVKNINFAYDNCYMKNFAAILLTLLALTAVNPMPVQANADERIEANAPQLKAASGYIELTVSSETTFTFHIFSITGQLIKRVEVSDGSLQVELPAGCYIVKCEKWSKKVIVK